MDLLSLVIAGLLALGSAGGATATDAGPSNTNTGTASSSEEQPTDTTEARSHIVDLG